MGKLRNKLMAGLVAALSVGSAAVNNNINVFASSAKDVKSSELVQKKHMYFKKDNSSFANLKENDVKSIFGEFQIPNENLRANKLGLLECYGILPGAGTNLGKKAYKILQSGDWYAMGNGLICDVHGNILTYGDLYPDDKNLHKGGQYELLEYFPVLSTNDWSNWIVKSNAGYGEIKISKKLLNSWGQLKYCDNLAMKIDNNSTILVNKDGKPLNFNGDKLVETDKENALQIDNDTFGLPYYKEPEEIIIEKQPEIKVKEDHLEKQSNQEEKIPKYEKPESTTNSAQPNSHSDVPSSQPNPSEQPRRSKSVVSKNAAIAASILVPGVILGGGITYTLKRSKSKSINKITNSNLKIQNNDQKKEAY